MRLISIGHSSASRTTPPNCGSGASARRISWDPQVSSRSTTARCWHCHRRARRSFPRLLSFSKWAGARLPIPTIWSPRPACVLSTSTTSRSWGSTMLAEERPQASFGPKASLQELHFEIEQLNSEYAYVLDNEHYDDFLDFFVEDCLYRVVPRENHLLRLPIAAIHCESKGMIKDRVYAARQSTMAEPRTLRHFISNVRSEEVGDEEVRAEANVLIVQTMINRMTEIVLSGIYLDRIVRGDGRYLFKERLCI